jgi:hypothetical protein
MVWDWSKGSIAMKKLALLVIGAAIALPAHAEVTQISSANPMPKGNNPNAKVCERQQKTGSRLENVTVCMTAQEWKDLRQGHRDDLEKVQRIVNQSPSN